MDVNNKDHQAVAEIIENYRAAWVNLDIPYLKSIWKEDEDDLVYVALEMAVPMHDLPTIKKYLDRAKDECGPPKMTVDDLHIKTIGDVATAYFGFVFEFSFVGKEEEVISAKGRVTAVLRRTANGWKLISYHEGVCGHRFAPE